MFLVPLNKKSILDSTISSTQRQQVPAATISTQPAPQATGTDSFYENKPDDDSINTWFNEQRILTFIDGSTIFVARTLSKSLATLGRWLNFSIQALLALIQPIICNLPHIIVPSPASSPFRIGRPINNHHQLIWRDTQQAISYLTGSTQYCVSNVNGHDCWCIAQTPNPEISLECNTRSDTTSSDKLDYENYDDDDDPMDLCRRRSARRTDSSNSNNTNSGSLFANGTSNSAYWQYVPSALMSTGRFAGANGSGSSGVGSSNTSASNTTTTATSTKPQGLPEQIGPLALAASKQRPQLQRQQADDAMEFQGYRHQLQEQQQQQRRRHSCGLQIDTSNGMGPQEYMRRQHQQKVVGASNTQTSPRGSSRYHSVCSAQPSNRSLSTLDPVDPPYDHHEPQKQQKENNNTNSAMNLNAQQARHFNLGQNQRHQPQLLNHRPRSRSELADGAVVGGKQVGGSQENSMVLVSKTTLNNLTDQIAFSMNKMKHLEEQVRVIPELQRRLDHVLVQTNDSVAAETNYLQQQQQQQVHHSNSQQRHQQPGRLTSESGEFNSFGKYDSRRRSNTNTASCCGGDDDDDDDIMKAIHPSLQRRYNSFRQYSANKADVLLHQQQQYHRDAISYRSAATSTSTTTTNSLNTRSPTAASRDYNRVSPVQVEHLQERGLGRSGGNNSIARHSLQFSRSPVCKSTLDNSINGSTHKTEYQDLINDLISLSYSVNYHSSSNTNSVQSGSTSSRRSQMRETKTADPSPQHQPMTNQQELASNNNNNKRQSSNGNSTSTTKLDCGCQSFKEHLRYNSISRELRLNNNNHNNHHHHARSRSTSATVSNPGSNLVSPQHTPVPQASKVDASTNTELSMSDIVTRAELDNMVSSIQKTYSTLSSIASREDVMSQFKDVISHKLAANHHPSISPTSSGDSISEPISSATPPDESSSPDSSDDGRPMPSECSSNKGIVDEDEVHKLSISAGGDDEEDSDDDEDRDEADGNGGELPDCEEPYSLGSSYQDPSDFEEYCAYGDSIDRRTKDFMSHSTKVPNDLRFALIRLNDFIKKNHSFEQIESSSGCVEVIRKEWFEAAANKESQVATTKLYVDYFESFTKQLLNTVVNLVDSAGNTAMHYAASHNKLDIIKVLLDTKVCDINYRNKAGYTPIMLLALADIVKPDEQEVARLLFSLGDVNIKARPSGQTAIMLAASHGRLATVKLLLECGADPSMQDYDGSTALMCASEMGNDEIVKCLLAHKLTDPNATDNDGLDALTIAMNNGHKNIGLILYAAKNVPRMVRSTMNSTSNNQTSLYNKSTAVSYLGASLRRSRGKLATSYVKRADSLLISRSSAGRPTRQYVDC